MIKMKIREGVDSMKKLFLVEEYGGSVFTNKHTVVVASDDVEAEKVGGKRAENLYPFVATQEISEVGGYEIQLVPKKESKEGDSMSVEELKSVAERKKLIKLIDDCLTPLMKLTTFVGDDIEKKEGKTGIKLERMIEILEGWSDIQSRILERKSYKVGDTVIFDGEICKIILLDDENYGFLSEEFHNVVGKIIGNLSIGIEDYEREGRIEL